MLDVEGTMDLPDNTNYVEAPTEVGLTDQDYELAEGNRMFADVVSTSSFGRRIGSSDLDVF